MSTTRSNCAWLAICLASIFFCLKIEATPVKSSQPADAFKTPFDIDEAKEVVSLPKTVVVRSADSDDNSVEGDDDENKDTKTEKPNSDNSEEAPHNKPHHHAHGSHGALGPVKHLLNTVRDHGNSGGGVFGGLGNILGAMHGHQNGDHESPIETEKDRDMINSSTGLHVLEFLGTLFGLLWGFLSNIPALFASSSSGASGGQ